MRPMQSINSRRRRVELRFRGFTPFGGSTPASKTHMTTKHSTLKLALALTLATLPLAASAQQFDFGGGATSDKPWESFKLNAKARVKLNLSDATADAVLSFYQKTSGITIIKDPALNGKLPVTSAKAVSLTEAFEILSAALSVRNYQITKEGNLLIVKQKGQMGGGMPQMPFPTTGADGGGMTDRSVLRVYPIQYANASALSKVIADVFQSATNNTGFPGMMMGGPGGQAGGFGGRGGGRFGNRGNQPGGFTGFGGFGQTSQYNVRSSSDDFSNSLIINATEKDQGQVREIIRQLDKPADQPQQSKVYRLQYASSDDLLTVVQNVLTANVPRGKGGATSSQTSGPGAFFNAIRGSVAGSGQVVSDTRSNSLVVTATTENLEIVDKVIKDLDREVESQSTTFVFPLNNARADQVSLLVQQAFGQRQGVNNNVNTNNRNNQNTGRVGGNNSNQSPTMGSTARSSLSGSNAASATEMAMLPIDLQDPNATSGDLATQVGVAQGFGGMFGGQQSRSSSSKSTVSTARDGSGKMVNIRDLTGQVTAIADINTNSIIVVTNPENAAIIKSILEQLDKIPEQVMIETIIVEASLDKTDKLGVEWSYNGKSQGTTSTGKTDFSLGNASPALTGLRYTMGAKEIGVFVNALQTDTKYQILSTPRIFTSNNAAAEINISQSIPYVVSSTYNSANNTYNYNYSFKDVGIVLTVTPRITSNGYVTMDVTQTANDLQGYTTFNAPIVNQRQADTTVSVRDGDTVILGGIIRNTVTSTTNKLPLLGDIPILGNLFRSSTKENQRTELLVLLTPHVVRDAEDARKLDKEEEGKLTPSTLYELERLRKGAGTMPVKNDQKPNGGAKP